MRRTGVISIGLLALTGVASAGMPNKVDQSHSFSGDMGSRSLDFQRAGAVTPAMGAELIGVGLRLELTVSGGSLMIDNDGPDAGTVSVFFVANLLLTSDDVIIPAYQTSVLNADRLVVGPDDEHPGGPPVFDFDGGPDTAGMPELASAYELMTFELPAGLIDQFRGTETFTLDADLSSSFGISGLPSVAGAFSGIVVESAIVTLSYTYTPAPGTLGVLAGGLMLTLRRRRLTYGRAG